MGVRMRLPEYQSRFALIPDSCFDVEERREVRARVGLMEVQLYTHGPPAASSSDEDTSC